MASKITVKQKEAKKIKFTITRAGLELDVADAVLTFGVKETKDDEAYLIEKNDSDFDKSDAAGGIVRIQLSATDTNQTPAEHVGELKIVIDADDIDKSVDIVFVVEQAVIM